MQGFEKIDSQRPTISFEYFPPKNPRGWGTLYKTLADAQDLDLDFASVTYGAGGSTRRKTISLVERIQNELVMEAMAHLTSVGHSKEELAAILTVLEEANVPAVMALRGDPPRGEKEFVPHPDGFKYGSEMTEFVAKNYNMKVGCACYPEGHIESDDMMIDIHYLKMKQDLGADFTITQLFFDNDNFYRFRDAAHAAGVTIPIIAGIMPVTSIKQLSRFKELSGCYIPQKLIDFLGKGPREEVVERAVFYAVDQCADLLDNDIAGIHLYTLNKSLSSAAIIQKLRRRGYFPVDEAD